MSVFLRTVSIITIIANLASKIPGGAAQPLGGVTMKSLGLLFEVSRWGSFLGPISISGVCAVDTVGGTEACGDLPTPFSS